MIKELLEICKETTCEIKNLATNVEYRNLGFAKQLLQYVFQNYPNNFLNFVTKLNKNKLKT